MGGGTGRGGGKRGTSPPQSFRRLTLCLWALHGKNRLQMVLVPPNRRAVAPPLGELHEHERLRPEAVVGP